jgi:outer membrane protein OmpA-like peptidoglycan-associated protein
MKHILEKGVYMTRRQWMWLWIWLLLFFIIFCVWDKLQKFTSDANIENKDKSSIATTVPAVAATTTAAVATAAEAMQKQTRAENAENSVNSNSVSSNKDINFKIVKEDGVVKISGVFSSQEDVDKLKQEYKKVFNKVEDGLIVIDKDAQNSAMIDIAPTLAEDLSKFESGYLEYVDNKLTVDGVIYDENIKLALNKKVASLGEDISIDNRLYFDPNKGEQIVYEAKKEEVASSDSKAEINQKMAQLKLNNLLKIKNVEFVFSKALLTKNGKTTVDEVATILNEYKDIRVEVGGHTDSRGRASMNQALSQQRANAIKNYLIKKGIDSKRLKAVGYGESKPLVNNNTAKNRQINRRVEFKIIGE